MENTRRKVHSSDWIPALILGAVVVGLAVVCFWMKHEDGGDWLVYSESLDQVAAEVNGQKLTLKDMAFYIAYDEMVVEEQAEVYNPEDTARYWNLKADGTYIRQLSKQNVMEKAIHDEIFYAMAVSEGVELTEDDEIKISEVQDQFWDNIMYGDKLDRLGVTESELNESIRKIGLAQKYQSVYSGVHQIAMEDLEVVGEGYEVLCQEYRCRVYDDVWDKVNYGDITLIHKNGIYQIE